jgi:hypothetical protein
VGEMSVVKLNRMRLKNVEVEAVTSLLVMPCRQYLIDLFASIDWNPVLPSSKTSDLLDSTLSNFIHLINY